MQKSLVEQGFSPLSERLEEAHGAPREPLWEPLSLGSTGPGRPQAGGVDCSAERVYGPLPVSDVGRPRVAGDQAA